MKRGFLTICALTLVSTLACTKKNKLDYGLDVKDTLRINLKSEPPSLDWSKSTDTTSSTVENNIMEGLVEYNLADPELGVIPALATEWKPSKDARVWTFTLRKGVKWTDGVEFTGQQVIDGWERLLNPATASEYAYFLFPVKNARAYNGGKIKDFKEVGIKMNDKGELVIELEKPMSFFPMTLTHHATFPIRKDVVEKHGDRWTDPDKIQTLGPYKLKVWDHDKALILERNEDYYGEKAKIKNIYGYMINEFSTAMNLIENGRLDFQEELEAKDLPRLRQKPGYKQTNSLMSYYYGFNTRKPPFDNVNVRKAFVHAVDRKQITDLMAAGHSPLTGWIPAGMLGYENDRGLKYDPVLAAKMLDEAGFKDRKKLPKITLAFNTNENHQRIAENVQAQLKKNLGVEVQIANEEWKVYLKRLQNDTPNIYRMGWLADYPDPSTFAELMTSYSENNHTGWGSKKYDELVVGAASSLDKEKRKALYSQLQKVLTEDEVPVLPIYSGVRQVMLNERVQNFPLTPLERWVFKGVSLK
ncbi:MAG: peptide ABC transporter substrate-binding protein [Bdellovibrionales bacterium]|nr:peptide ABC transporter substrate-binding protein [Bdellovibrionales bacterium]